MELLLIIIIILLIVIYGGPRKHVHSIEYNPKNYKFLNNLSVFESQLQKYNIPEDVEFQNITKNINLTNCLIPNIIDIFYVNIGSHKFFDIRKHIDNTGLNIMILYSHTTKNNNFAVIDNITNDKLMLLIDKQHECNDACGLYGYFYNVTRKISILDIYPIYNDSDKTVNLTLLILKKPYWFS
ncbi:MAG: hypothetical protein Gaeavirus5_13 [Gaeavirus sp.]|uniref:Uncharacterized protein n=1 Tax=Gaeavirus sp. TaxID=2487767 RepID=A0A3G4ZYL2_9VIRU|nr:MAG: hypothetical protein Gaeavirus5_13 [Gaeavirus sp.]